MQILLSNYQEWLPITVIATGVMLALISPFVPHRRERRQLAAKLVETFHAGLHSHDLQHWRELYHGTHDYDSVPRGHYIDNTGQVMPLESMWTSGNDDHTAIQRMAELLEKTCAELLNEKADIKHVWYETGQLLEAIYGWLASIPGVNEDLTFLEEQYPAIRQVYEKHRHQFEKWPYRSYLQKS